MTPDDLFDDGGIDAWGLRERKLNLELVDAIRTDTQTASSDATALALAEQIHSDLMAYGTGGGEELTEVEMKLAIRALTAACERLGVPLRVRFRDYTSFRTYWTREGASGSWHARRVIVSNLLDPVIDALTARSQNLM